MGLDAGSFSKRMAAQVERHCRGLRFSARGRKTARQVLHCCGLPHPWPAVAHRFADLSDELEGRVQTDDLSPHERQWNALSGVWPLKPTVHRQPAALPPNRRVPALMRSAARALYGVVHETTHLVIAELALRGLLRTAADPVAVHVLGELFAEYVSHYELGVETATYWRRHWRPMVEGSEAQDCNAGLAAIRAGARSRAARAELAVSSYFDGPVPRDVDMSSSPELLSVWSTHRAYAAKTWDVCRQWQRLYWDDPALVAFVADFVPATPADVWLRGRTRPVAVASLRETIALMPILLSDWRSADPATAEVHTVRRRVQRTALAVAQLERLVRSDRTELTSRRRALALEHIAAARDRLVRAYRAVPRIRAPDRILASLLTTLSRTCTKTVFVQHPTLTRQEMSEYPLRVHHFAEVRWPKGRASRAGLIAELESSLDAMLAAATLTRVHRNTTSRCGGLLPLVQRARREVAGLCPITDSARAEAVLAHVRRCCTAASSTRSRDISVPYRWAWARTRPFMDPLIGFHIQ